MRTLLILALLTLVACASPTGGGGVAASTVIVAEATSLATAISLPATTASVGSTIIVMPTLVARPTEEPSETPVVEPTLAPSATLTSVPTLALQRVTATQKKPTMTQVVATRVATRTAVPPPTRTISPPTSTVAPTTVATTALPTQSAPPVAADGRYWGHVWQSANSAAAEREAQQLCSSVEAIKQYNHATELVPDMAVIVPVTQGCTPTSPTERFLLDRGVATRPRVALTLDAGASAAPTPKMLAALRERNVRITFFLTGRWMQDYPELLKEIVRDGHEIANHSLTHADFTKLSAADVVDELRQTEELAWTIGGTNVRPFFRPPYGAYNRQVLETVIAAGYVPIYWTVDSLDSVGKPKSPQFLVERVTNHLPPERLNGAIFLMHCGSEPTAAALPIILDRFAEMGIEVTTIARVLGP